MTKQKIIYQLSNLINNSDLTTNQREALLDYFSHLSKVHQDQVYIVLIKNPDFIKTLSSFVIQEREAIVQNNEQDLTKIFTQELQEIENNLTHRN